MAGAPEKIKDVEILRYLDLVPEGFAGVSEIARAHDVHKKTVQKRVADLYERGLVGRKSLGRPYGYWITEKGRAHLEEAND